MANTKVTTGVIKDDAVGADQLASNAVVTASITDNAVTTAKISDDAILTAKISNSAITNAKMSANSVDSDQYVDASIDTAHIRDGQITSAKLDTNISVSGELTVGSHLNMGDGDILKMGASADLQIYHHSNGNSIISETGSGDLFIQATNVQIENAGGDNMIVANSGGAVNLYYSAAEKLATTSSGIDVTGTANVGSLSSGSASSASEIIATSLDNGTSFGSNRMLKIIGTSTTDNSRMGIHFTGNTGIGNGLAIIEAVNEDQSAGHTSLRMHTYSGSWNENNLVLKSGKVGIGVSNPSEMLHMNNTAGTGCFIRFQNTGGSGVYIGGRSEVMEMYTNGSEKMRIDSSGNVGIGGSSNLDNKLELLGNLRIRNAPSSNPQIKFNNADVEMIALELESGATGVLGLRGNAVNIDSSGNVGIGTTSPQTALHVSTSSASIARFERSGSATYQLTVTDGGTGAAQLYFQALDNDTGFNFQTKNSSGSAVDALFITPTGNVGIGNTAPQQKLTVSGSVWASGYYITALQGNSQLTNASTSSGSNPSYIGQGLITVTISDAKAKENFASVETSECLNKIVSLSKHVKKFDWIDEDWKKEKGRTVGMVAQEIYEDHSEFVHRPKNYDDDGWAIRYQEIVPTLVKAIQEQQEQIDELKAKLEDK